MMWIRITAPVAVACAVAFVSMRAPGEGRPRSTSIGNPNNGRLVGGVRLPDKAPGLLSNPYCPNKEAKYGTEELISTLLKAAADVEARAPGAKMWVNDLGFAEGGSISHHQSHQAGRDVDILFYANRSNGEIARPLAVHYNAKGQGTFNSGTRGDTSDDIRLTFDRARNWEVLKSMIVNQDAHLARVFISEGLRSLLLEYGRTTGEPPWVLERAGELMCEPRVNHDDHFHMRLFCTEQDYAEGCRDSWPLFPWRRTELARSGIVDPQLGVRPPQKRARRRSRSPRRNTPGRTWCP